MVVGTIAELSANESWPPLAASVDAPPAFLKSGWVQSVPVSRTATAIRPGMGFAAVAYLPGTRLHACTAWRVCRAYSDPKLVSFGVCTTIFRMWFGSTYATR